MNKRLQLFIILLFLIAGGVSANEVLNDQQCTVPADTVIQTDLLVLCSELLIEGRVEGHVMGAARTVIVRGEVTGSLYVVAVEMRLDGGSIGKDVHFGGLLQSVSRETTFQHEAGGVLGLNLSTTIEPGTRIPGSINQVGYQLVMDGTVEREISFWGAALHIGGTVGQGVTATVGDSESQGAASQIETLLIPFRFDEVALVDPGLRVNDDAQVDGILRYTAPTPGEINGRVEEVAYEPIEEPLAVTTQVEQSARSLQRYFEEVFREFLTLGLIGVLFLLIFPNRSQSAFRAIQSRPISTFGVGLLSFILSFPIVLIVALASLIIVIVLSLLPVQSFAIFGGIALGLANIGGASVFYFMAIYVARMVVALAIGRALLPRFLEDDNSWRFRFLSLGLGVLILAIFVSIPVIGLGLNALALFLGLGAILSVLRRQIERFATSNRPQVELPSLPDYTPPLLPEGSRSTKHGTQNLPEGFNWWRE